MSKNSREITNTLIDQEPTMCAWKLSTRDVEDFIYNYLVEAGIDGVKRPTVLIDREGTNSNVGVSAFAFISPNSKDVIDNGRDIDNAFMRELVSEIRYKPSKKLKAVLSTISCFDKQTNEFNTKLSEANTKVHVLFIRLDVIRILAAMLKAPRNQYQVVVMQAINTARGEGQLYVAKQENFGGRGNGEDDIYRGLARELSRGKRN